MCGIVGAVSKRNIVPILVQGLQRLEYRGYDSCGVAVNSPQAQMGQAPGLQGLVYGLVLIAFVLFEPMGLYGRWLKVRTYMEMFPFYRKGMFKRQKSFQKSDRLK